MGRVGHILRAFAFLLALVLAGWPLAARAQSSSSPQTVDGDGEWRNGKGTCTGAANIQNGAPGLSNFNQPARVTVDGHHISVAFRRPSTGAYDSVPSEGDVARDGSFETKNTTSTFGTFTWTGKLDGTAMAGVVTENTGGENGAPCSATWDLTIRLERVLPLSGDTVERSASSSEPSTSASSSSSSSTSTSDDGIDWFPIGAVAAGVLAAGAAVYAWLKTRTRDVPPTVDKPASDPCECSCTMEVTGPDRLYLCDCADPIWDLRPLAPRDLGEGQTIESMDPAVLDKSMVLVVKVPAGSKCPRNRPDNVLCSRLYQAPVTSTCQNGGQVTKVVRQWMVDSSAFRKGQDTPIKVKVTATVTITCPKGSHTVTVTAEKSTSIRPEKPHVYVVLNDPPASLEPPHAGVRITCGEFDRIYGFYPEERAGLMTVVPGAGQVKVLGRDGVQQDFARIDDYYSGAKKSTFEVPVTCEQCAEVQDYWERLRANPGRYGLANNNCAVQALKSVEPFLPPLPANASIFDKTPTLSPPGAVTLLSTLGLKETITPAKLK